MSAGLSVLVAQQPDVDPTELPRIPRQTPVEALASMEVAEGFAIETVAAEPLVVDPVAMSFDEWGRLYVVEMRDYSERRPERMGRVRLLEDRDKDGVMDHSTVFLEDLPWPTAIISYDGGVFVGATPDIVFARDSDGDGQADRKQVVLTGFADDYAPYETNRLNVQALMNSFRWGLDNRIHGSASASGGHVHSPAHPDRPKVNLRGRDFSFDPRTLELRAESGGAQHGMSFDDYGRKYVCSNSDHLQAVIYDDRYSGLNPWRATRGPRISIAEDGPAAPVYRLSGEEPWRVMRTKWRVAGRVGGPVEGGGRPSGYFTGATGAVIYRGDQWPEEHVGHAVIADVGSNLIHRKQIVREGVVASARRYAADAASEFVASRSNWFRPVQFANAPDGTLWVADMAREVIEHPWSLPSNIKQHLDLNSGNGAGRLYRIRSTERPMVPTRPLGGLEGEDLVAVLGHRNGWHRDTAARLVFQRQDPSLAPALEELAQQGGDPRGRVHALYALHGCGLLGAKILQKALSDADSQVRVQGIRLLEEQASLEAFVDTAAFAALLEDAAVGVRYQLALSLGRLEYSRKNRDLYRLMRTSFDNPWVWQAVCNSAGGDIPGIWEHVLGDLDWWTHITRRRAFLEICDFSGHDMVPQALSRTVQSIAELEDSRLGMNALRRLLARAEVSDEQLGDLQRSLQSILTAAETLVVDEGESLEDRQLALELLQRVRSSKLWRLVRESIGANPSSPMVTRGLQVCQSLIDEERLEWLAGFYDRFLPSARRQFIALLLRRGGRDATVLDLIEGGRLTSSELTDAQRSRLMRSSVPELRERARTLLERPQRSLDEEMARWLPALLAEARADNGERLYLERCATCHRLGDLGATVGPEVRSMRSLRKRGILQAILDPNMEVAPQYLSYSVETADEERTGIVVNESDRVVTLRQAGGLDWVVPKSEIRGLSSQDQSLMPVGLLEGLGVQDVADLLHFLMYGEGTTNP